LGDFGTFWRTISGADNIVDDHWKTPFPNMPGHGLSHIAKADKAKHFA